MNNESLCGAKIRKLFDMTKIFRLFFKKGTEIREPQLTL